MHFRFILLKNNETKKKNKFLIFWSIKNSFVRGSVMVIDGMLLHSVWLKSLSSSLSSSAVIFIALKYSPTNWINNIDVVRCFVLNAIEAIQVAHKFQSVRQIHFAIFYQNQQIWLKRTFQWRATGQRGAYTNNNIRSSQQIQLCMMFIYCCWSVLFANYPIKSSCCKYKLFVIHVQPFSILVCVCFFSVHNWPTEKKKLEKNMNSEINKKITTRIIKNAQKKATTTTHSKR